MQENKAENNGDVMNNASENINQNFDSLRDLLMSLKGYFIDWGIGDFWSGILVNLLGALVLFVVSWLAYLLVRRVVLRAIRFLLIKSDNDWGNVLIENKVFLNNLKRNSFNSYEALFDFEKTFKKIICILKKI